jgi:hypothetical protein
MARRGRCRCGVILSFHKRPWGYKTRCPNCQSVVRLRIGPHGTRPPQPAALCSCGTAIDLNGRQPLTCPNCHKLFEPALPRELATGHTPV